MKAKDLILNIAVNLDRISRFLEEGKEKRARLFMEDNEFYIKEVDKKKLNLKFKKTFELFKKQLVNMKDSEDFLNWANILQHRAKIA